MLTGPEFQEIEQLLVDVFGSSRVAWDSSRNMFVIYRSAGWIGPSISMSPEFIVDCSIDIFQYATEQLDRMYGDYLKMRELQRKAMFN